MVKFAVINENDSGLDIIDICGSAEEAEKLAASEFALLKGEALENTVIAIREITDEDLAALSDVSSLRGYKLVKEFKK